MDPTPLPSAAAPTELPHRRRPSPPHRSLSHTTHIHVRSHMRPTVTWATTTNYLRATFEVAADAVILKGSPNSGGGALSRMYERRRGDHCVILARSQPLVGLVNDLKNENETMEELRQLHGKLDREERIPHAVAMGMGGTKENVIMNVDAPALNQHRMMVHLLHKNSEQKLARKNELKAKSTLLLAIPDEHLLKFCHATGASMTWPIVPVETPANALVVQDGIGGYDWSFQAEEGPTDFALMAHLSSGSSSSSSSDSEVSTCSKACLKSYESLKEHFDKQKEQLKKSNLEIIGYQLGLESLEARIVVHQKNEAVYEEDIAFLKYDVKVRDNSITELKNQLAEALREKDDLKLKLEKFETSSKNLTDLLNSQISVNNKTGIGFDSQMTENELHDIHKNNSEVFESASDSSVNEIEEENNQVNDRFKKVEGYHAFPPPYTGNYMPSRPDLSFAGLDDSVYKTNVSETITSVPRNESTASKSSKDNLEQPKDVRPSAPIVEEWE
ncbi:hypothetical protein Tco_0629041 [Tanacetum coccineum]|uniref:Uncharacterized protein n=1 Tax=Tanacetum coccineum TaxID=301880 RepID=A0ABQ4WRZ7_9ASTR